MLRHDCAFREKQIARRKVKIALRQKVSKLKKNGPEFIQPYLGSRRRKPSKNNLCPGPLMSREPRVCVTASSTLDRTSLYSPTAPSFLGGIGSTPNLIPTDWIGKAKRSGDETAPFFGFLGAAAALVFSCMGAAYGTAKSGVGVASMGVMRPELVMKSIVPVVMAGVLGIYGLIIAVIISTGINPKTKSYYLFDGYAHLSSGLACGLAGLSAGMAIGIVGDAGVRANAQQPKLFVGMILILIFAEALALYGLIVGIILSSRAGQSRAE
nr:V-type proton ATPase 16 kDa proteolipid subunit [Ipomoea batatas]